MTTTTKPMTEAQFSYAISLAVKLHSDPAKRAEALLTLAGCDFNSISVLIDAMKANLAMLPKTYTPASASFKTTVAYVPPVGTYLVGSDQVQVKQGKFSGQVYLVVNGAYKGSLSSSKAAPWAVQLDDPEKAKAAVVAYGAKTGKCGKCGHKLTDPESIAKKIGPVCEKKYF